jgi:hypothetical protein
LAVLAPCIRRYSPGEASSIDGLIPIICSLCEACDEVSNGKFIDYGLPRRS